MLRVTYVVEGEHYEADFDADTWKVSEGWVWLSKVMPFTIVASLNAAFVLQIERVEDESHE